MTATDTEPTFDDGYLGKPAPLPNPPAAALRLIYRHHHNRPDSDALFRAAVEQVVDAEHGPDHLLRSNIVALYLSSEFWPRVVARAVAIACGPDDDPEHTDRVAAMRSGRHPAGRYMRALKAISQQAPGQPEETPS